MTAKADKEYYSKPSPDFVELLEAARQLNRIKRAMILARCE